MGCEGAGNQGAQQHTPGRILTERLDWRELIAPRASPRPEPGLRPIINGGGESGYGRAALTAELEQLLSATEGGRNDQLNRSAFSLAQLVASGHLPGDIQEELRAAALHIGLAAPEVDATLRSAFRAGGQQPRVVELRGAPERIDVADLIAPAHIAAPGDIPVNNIQPDVTRTSWWPLPIVERAAQAAETPTPTHLVRDDGQPLCYSGKVNGLIGESESGKSWVALLAVVQALAGDERVLLLDFEDSPAAIHGRLSVLGVTAQQLAGLDYANPDEALGLAQGADLTEALRHAYALIVVDGINAAMTLLGYDLNSNTDATLFAQKLLRPLAATGACVITVDHVPKNSEQRGKGGIGAQAKRAMVDGCTLLVEVMEPFGKGQSGTLRLLVDKDRPGHVRGASGNSSYAGQVHLDSDADRVRLRIVGPDLRPAGEREPWRPTGVMEKVSRLLEGMDGAPSYRAIEDAVGGRKDIVKKAVIALVEDGYVRLEPGSNRSIRHHLERPYRESDVLTSPVSPGVPQVSPGDASAGVPQPPPPYGVGGHPAGSMGPSVSPANSGGTQQLDLEHPEGWSDCNRCGQPTDPETLDETAGYCRNCGRVMNP